MNRFGGRRANLAQVRSARHFLLIVRDSYLLKSVLKTKIT